MNVTKAISSRYSCRAFKSKQIRKEILRKLIEISCRAPSWANTQPWEIFVASGAKLERLRKGFLENLHKQVPRAPELSAPSKWPDNLKKRIDELMNLRLPGLKLADDEVLRKQLAVHNYGFFNAPAVIYLCMDKSLAPWALFDMGLFAQTMMLAAKQYGLDTIPAVMLVAYPDLIRLELKIPDNLLILIGIAIGYPDKSNDLNKFRSPRRSVDEIVNFKGL